MEAGIQKWGNSIEIRIPSHVLKSLDLKLGEKIELKYDNKKIVLMKMKKISSFMIRYFLFL